MSRNIRLTGMVIILFLFSFFLGCDPQKPPESGGKKKMLIYCGITMIKPMLEIARIIEAQENAKPENTKNHKLKIIITKGGSGNLLKSILYTKRGDLYLPGSDKYYQVIEKDHPGLILETVPVGQNKASIMVQKGNPRGITNDLQNFTSKDYAVVIGNANSGSIGKETKSIFDKKGIYDQVIQNAMQLTTDSKDLVKVLVNKEADIVINWYATSTWDENKDAMEAIGIDPEFATAKKLVLGLLKYSQNPELARKFMHYASSDQGKAIFKKYGLYF